MASRSSSWVEADVVDHSARRARSRGPSHSARGVRAAGPGRGARREVPVMGRSRPRRGFRHWHPLAGGQSPGREGGLANLDAVACGRRAAFSSSSVAGRRQRRIRRSAKLRAAPIAGGPARTVDGVEDRGLSATGESMNPNPPFPGRQCGWTSPSGRRRTSVGDGPQPGQHQERQRNHVPYPSRLRPSP
jgi:hypothetical protein